MSDNPETSLCLVDAKESSRLQISPIGQASEDYHALSDAEASKLSLLPTVVSPEELSAGRSPHPLKIAGNVEDVADDQYENQTDGLIQKGDQAQGPEVADIARVE